MKWIKLFVLGFLLSTQLHAQDLPDNKSWTLKDCLDYALENNIDIKKATLDKKTASLNYQQSKHNKLPSVTAGGSGSVSNGYAIDQITSNFINQTIYSNSYNVNAQIPVYQGNKLNLEIDKNKYLVEQSELYQKQSENDITLSVLEQYLQALYYYEGIQIAKNNLASSKSELDYTKTKFDNGAIARKDLADIETQYAQNKYNLVNAQTLFNQQVTSLKQLLELPPQYDFKIKQSTLPELSSNIPDKMKVFNSALEQLPDVKLYDTQNDILEKELAITKSAMKPTVSVGAGLNTGFTNTMDYNYFTQIHRNFSQQGNVTLSIPIFSKFQNKTNVSLAKINLEQNKLDKANASKALYSKIETAWLNATSNIAEQQSAKEAKDNAQLAYELATKKFEFGGLTTTELSVSKNTYLNAEQTYLQTKYMAVLYRQLLNYYQGKPFDIINN